MAVGGSVSGAEGCKDFAELVKVAPKSQSVPDVGETVATRLRNQKPQGRASLQEALQQVVTTNLAGRDGIQQINVITSRVDRRCSTLDRSVLNRLARDAGTRFTLIIYTVGTLSRQDKKLILTAYADVWSLTRHQAVSTT